MHITVIPEVAASSYNVTLLTSTYILASALGSTHRPIAAVDGYWAPEGMQCALSTKAVVFTCVGMASLAQRPYPNDNAHILLLLRAQREATELSHLKRGIRLDIRGPRAWLPLDMIARVRPHPNGKWYLDILGSTLGQHQSGGSRARHVTTLTS